MYTEGMPVVVAKRGSVDCLDPQIKGLNYLGNILAKMEAIDAGVLSDHAEHPRRRGRTAEGQHLRGPRRSNPTPDLSAGMLSRITRFVMTDVAGVGVACRRVQSHTG